jgi:hypothetical protein
MNTTVFITCLLIVLARITDVSLGTLRMVAVIQGRRAFATVLGFLSQLTEIAKSGTPTASERLRPWLDPLERCAWFKRVLS